MFLPHLALTNQPYKEYKLYGPVFPLHVTGPDAGRYRRSLLSSTFWLTSLSFREILHLANVHRRTCRHWTRGTYGTYAMAENGLANQSQASHAPHDSGTTGMSVESSKEEDVERINELEDQVKELAEKANTACS